MTKLFQSKFVLVPVSQVKGRIEYWKLEIDGHCQFDDFYAQVHAEGNLAKQLPALFQIMNDVANLKSLPVEKFKEITPAGDTVNEYEVKKGDLRVYLIKYKGHIIILGGKKNAQKKDIRKFRSIKQRYLQYLQS